MLPLSVCVSVDCVHTLQGNVTSIWAIMSYNARAFERMISPLSSRSWSIAQKMLNLTFGFVVYTHMDCYNPTYRLGHCLYPTFCIICAHATQDRSVLHCISLKIRLMLRYVKIITGETHTSSIRASYGCKLFFSVKWIPNSPYSLVDTYYQTAIARLHCASSDVRCTFAT